ncbi:MAG: hypothetical protein Q9165_003985 [Trypethelium subeluteriae]
MVVGMRGRGAKPANKIIKIKKHSTPSSKQHHYESFSQRIAKLNINPIRRARHYDLDETEDRTVDSYFRSSLQEWQDLNLTENFTSFVRVVQPLSENLPQILHHQDRIVDTVVAYLEKGDILSLQPLLSLVAHLAHDLGPKFEKHFGRIFTVISRLASAQNQSVEVVEWSFNCLAWLFKYLSKLLVPDLRPLFDLAAPLLGKERQKPFVARFAAEAMSFLIREAARVYERDPRPLDLIVSYALEDLIAAAESSDATLYSQGLMTLFAGAINGVQKGLHPNATATFRCLAQQTIRLSRPDDDLSYSPDEVLLGVLTSTSHHANDENFDTIVHLLLSDLNVDLRSDAVYQSLLAEVLFVIVSTRHRTKGLSWSSIIASFERLIQRSAALSLASEISLKKVMRAFALIISFAPLDCMIPCLHLIDLLSSQRGEEYFLPLCVYSAELSVERFQSLLLPHFQRFFLSKWDTHHERLTAILPVLISKSLHSESVFTISSAVQHDILNTFHKLQTASQDENISHELLCQCNSYLDLLDVAKLPNSDERDIILASLQRLLEHALKDDSTQTITTSVAFAAGRGFSHMVSDSRAHQWISTLWKEICERSSMLKNVPGFMHTVRQIVKPSDTNFAGTLEGSHIESLIESIIDCLQSPSHDLRLAGLELLEAIHTTKQDRGNDIISIALSIERSPFDIQSLRAAAIYTRRLASRYSSDLDPWLQKAAPAYCFGLLHVNLRPLWDDACYALKEMSSTVVGEEAIAQIALAWIRREDADAEQNVELSSPMESSPEKQMLSDFEDMETLRLEVLFKNTTNTVEASYDQLRISLRKRTKPIPMMTNRCLPQALRVLNKIPAIAEKRSRAVVPLLLEWVNQKDTTESGHVSTSNGITHARWSREDRKAMLGIFAQFVNPRVLYQSGEAYEALLTLLCNGDAGIQKPALKAILTWKQPSVKRYEEHIMNILEDAKFREELAVFLNVDQDDSELQKKDWNDIMPIVLRLLYGRIISKTGSGSGGNQQAKRRAVFNALVRFGSNEISQFLGIALYPIHNLAIVREGRLHDEPLDRDLLSQRRQSGLLNLVEDFMKDCGFGLAPFAPQLVDAILYCTVRASRVLRTSTSSEKEQKDDGPTKSSENVSPRTVRQVGIRCLNLLFEFCPTVLWEPYVALIFRELVDPRLDKLSIESAQSVSGLFRMFSIWSGSLNYTPFLIHYNVQLIEEISRVLDAPFAKDEVKNFVITDILSKLIALTNADISATPSSHIKQRLVREEILKPNSETFLTRLAYVLQGSPSKDLLDAAVQAVSRLAPFVTGSSNSRTLVQISVFLLQQPSQRVRPHIKSGVLEILDQFVPLVHLSKDDALFISVYETLASFFGFFKDRVGQTLSRPLLCNIFGRLAQIDHELEGVTELCHDLNAMSTTRLDEPDFERRSHAFNIITHDKFQESTAHQWHPVVYNMLFFVKDEDDAVTRKNASYGLRRFIEGAAKNSPDGVLTEKFETLISAVLLPAIFIGVRDAPELVRIEYLSVLVTLLRRFPHWGSITDMQNLLMGDDEEASFFTNILHIQQHRRLRALRRLGTEANSDNLQSKNISKFFIPLVEHFIFDKADNENAHNLAAEAINAVKALVAHLEWTQYRATFQRYLGYLTSKPEEMQKTVIRLLGAVVDTIDSSISKTSSAAIQEFIVGKIIPPLTEYLHHKDESNVSLRIPVAVTVVKSLQHLSPAELSSRLPPVLMDTCHILRSRDQGSRDMTRKALAEISTLLGSPYFKFVLVELQSALKRGYQLHVLSFTVHSILVEAIPCFKPGDLDYCISKIVNVIMDDIFGVTGQEKDAEEYASRMKEVKSSKSFDSMEMIARVTTTDHLSKLIQPLQALLLEKLDGKMVRKIDELLRRIGLGVSQNEAIGNRDVLVFCYEIIQEVYKFQSNPHSIQQVGGNKTARYLNNMNASAKSGNRGTTSSYVFKLLRFSLDLLRSVLRKHEELKTPANLSGFVPMLGDALVGGQEEIQTSTLRLLASIIKVPLPDIASNALVYATEAVRIIRQSPSADTEISQAALQLVSAILRERRDTVMKERDLAYLLEALLPDLQEPNRQGVTFNFLRAFLGRKIVITEVYKVMDEVRGIIVKSHMPAIRDSARGAYIQFLMEYPQGKKGFKKQLQFLCDNLEFEYAEGRQSVIDTILMLLSKTGEKPTQDIISLFFPFLVIRLNDEEDKTCQEKLEALLKKIFERADVSNLDTFVKKIKSHLEQDEILELKTAAIRIWVLYLDGTRGSTKDTEYFQDRLRIIITNARAQLEHSTTEAILPSALASALQLFKVFPTSMLSDEYKAMWDSIISLTSASALDIQLPAVQLLGLLFRSFARHNEQTGLEQLPLTGSGGIQLGGERLRQLTVLSLRTMRTTAPLSEVLMDQTVSNLVFLGRCFGANGLLWRSRKTADADSSDEGENSDVEELDQNLPQEEQRTAINWLLSRLSHITRQNEALGSTPAPKLPSLNLLGSLLNHLSRDTITSNLLVILASLNHYTDPRITHPDSPYTAALRNRADELLNKVQDKVGEAAYIRAIEEVKGDVREKREVRGKKRVLDKVTEDGIKRSEAAKKRKMVVRKAREQETRKAKGVIYQGATKRQYR